MIRRLATATAATIAALGLSVVAAASPSGAAAPVLVDSSVQAYTGYLLMATVPGRAGNAHAGYIYFDAGDVRARMADWQCPAGAEPPTNDEQTGPLTCTKLRSQEFYYLTLPTFHGLLRSTISGPFPLVEDFPGEVTKATAPFYLSFRRVGPITTTVTPSPRPVGAFRVTQSAPMQLSGRLDWLRLSDPRVQVTQYYYQRDSDYQG